jgi:hypothetical protein
MEIFYTKNRCGGNEELNKSAYTFTDSGLFQRRLMRRVLTPTASNPKVEGSGTG